MSTFQALKFYLLDLVPISRDAFHMYIGFGCFLVAFLCWPRARSSVRVLVPGIIISVVLEILDLRDDMQTLGHGRWLASAHDIINTNVIPVCLYFLIRLRWLQFGRTTR